MKDREQIHGYVPRELRKRLRHYAAKKGVSESSVTHAALSRYLGDTDDTPLILRKLSRIERTLARITRDADIRAEAFGVFVQIWLAHTPRLEESERAAAESSARRRFADFTDHVAEQVAAGGSFVSNLIREDLADPDELVAAAAGPELAGEPATEP